MHLFELEVEVFGLGGEFGHVFGCAAGVAADEVGDDLLAQVVASADVVEEALEVVEEAEGGFAHELEHTVGGVFGGYFETAADVAGDEFFGVLAVDAVGVWVARVVEQEVVADAGADETLFDAREGIDGMVDVEELGVVGVEVAADVGIDAGGTFALVAKVEVAAVHGIHVGRGSAEVAEVAFEVGQLGDGLDFAEDAFFASRGDELALMG